jgi:hypothetical protein
MGYSRKENTTALDDYIKSLTPQVRGILAYDPENPDKGPMTTLQAVEFTWRMELEVQKALRGVEVGPYERTYKGNKHDIRQQLLSDYIKFQSEQMGVSEPERDKSRRRAEPMGSHSGFPG